MMDNFDMRVIESAGTLLGICESPDPITPLHVHVLSMHHSSISGVIAALTAQLNSNALSSEDMYDFYKLFYALKHPSPRLQQRFKQRKEQSGESLELLNFLDAVFDRMGSLPQSIKLKRKDCVLVLDDSMDSLIAAEVAAHIWVTNTIHVQLLRMENATHGQFLSEDVISRFEKHFLISAEYLTLSPIEAQNCIKMVEYRYINTESKYMVLGCSGRSNTDPLQKMTQWAAWISSYPVILSKQSSNPSSFTSSSMARKWILCVKSIEFLDFSFQRLAELARPSDYIVFFTILESSHPRQISRTNAYYPNFIKEDNQRDWNRESSALLRERMDSLIAESRIYGEVKFEVRSTTHTIGQQICQLVADERADFVVLNRGKSNRVPKECVAKVAASIVLI